MKVLSIEAKDVNNMCELDIDINGPVDKVVHALAQSVTNILNYLVSNDGELEALYAAAVLTDRIKDVVVGIEPQENGPAS